MRTIGLALILAAISCSKSDPPAPSASAPTTVTPAPSSAAPVPVQAAPKPIAVGDEVYAYDPVLLERSADLMVYPTEKLFDAWDKATATENSDAQMRVIKQTYTVPPGGKVAVMDLGKKRAKVRIVTGDHAGKEGFLPIETLFASPQKSAP
jgi:hypothetical protein